MLIRHHFNQIFMFCSFVSYQVVFIYLADW